MPPVLLLLLAAGPEPAPKPRPAGPDLSGFRTAKTVIRADPKAFAPAPTAARPGFAGVEVADSSGTPIVGAVAPGSPAEAAGLKPGDIVTAVGDTATPTPASLKDRLRRLVAGEPAVFAVRRSTGPLSVRVTPRPLSQPFVAADAAGRPLLGLQTQEADGGGLEVTAVTPDGPADKAGVKPKDRVLKMDDEEVQPAVGLRELLARRRPGDTVALLVRRGQDELTVRVTLVPEAQPKAGGGWDDRLPRAWAKPTFRLAVVGIDYPDVKHNPKVTGADWEQSLFSVGQYTKQSATGAKVFGSMADYYREISYGRFAVEGKFVGWVEAAKKRLEYSSGSGTSVREKTALLSEVLTTLEKKNPDALKGFDGVFFLFAGGRVQTTRGGLYWPHRATLRHAGKAWPYFIVQEGAERMTDISVFCHEFGHMLGLPDLYARPEVPGMEGVGQWCAMSQQIGGGRPQHFSAWCKEQLGWLRPVPVDPRVKQRVVLSPVGDDPGECLKVLLKPDASEYLLLENRQRKGFDTQLPADGLLVWRVIPGNQNQKVFLEEAHGVEGPSGPRNHLREVPFPSAANTSFTPYTTPSSRSQTGGGLEVWLTDVRRLPDGRVTFALGYEYQ